MVFLRNNIMVDIRPVDTLQTAKILALAAVSFDPISGTAKSEFYRKINVNLYDNKTLFTSSISCMDEFYKEWYQTDDVSKVSIKEAMSSFVSWVKEIFQTDEICIWSHHPTIEIPILEYTLQKLDIKTPWSFWNIMHTRTVYELSEILYKNIDSPKDYPLYHPLGNCYRQIEGLRVSFKKLKITL